MGFGAKQIRAHRDVAAAMTALGGLIVGGGFFGGFSAATGADRTAPVQVAQMQDRCASGTEVSAFVCRNTWLA